jgi:4-amino-4-deoxychorismate lyase
VSPTPQFWVDGNATQSLPLPDRGVELGDGLFETLLLRRGHILYPDLHLQRLQRGLQVLGFPACMAQARTYLDAAAANCAQQEWAALRLTVTRGSAPRGYAPPANATPRILVAVTAITRDCREPLPPAIVQWSQLHWGSQPALVGIKHLNRLEQVLAASEARQAGLDDVLVADQQGRPISTSSGNLFALCGDRLLTPALTDCGIAGTRRCLVLERWAPAIGIAVAEAALSVGQVEEAKEVFYCNSLQGVRPVAALGDRQWREHPVAQRLQRCLVEDLPC